MSASRRPAGGWDLLFAVSLLATAAAAWFAFVRPHLSGAMLNPRANLASLKGEARSVASKADGAELRVKSRTWNVGPAMFGSQVLDSLSKLASASHLQLTGVRVGKPLKAASLTEVPLFVSVQGRFMDVMKMVDALEEPGSKIAIGQIDVAAANNGDQVSATLSVSGFLDVEGS